MFIEGLTLFPTRLKYNTIKAPESVNPKVQRIFHLKINDSKSRLIACITTSSGSIHFSGINLDSDFDKEIICSSRIKQLYCDGQPILTSRNYQIALSSDHKELYIYDSSDGRSILIGPDGIHEWKTSFATQSDTVHSVICVSNVSDGNYEWIFSIRGPDKGSSLWCSSSDGRFDDLKIQIPANKHPWATCGVRSGSTLVFGTRSGHVIYYDAAKKVQFTSLHSIHGSNGVTLIQKMDRSNGSEFFTSGRNGQIVYWDLDSLRAGVPKREIRSGVQWPIEITEKAIYGFHSSYFKVFDRENINSPSLLFESECGGGHRSCSFWIEKGHFYLAYVKKGELHMDSNRVLGKILKIIKCVKLIGRNLLVSYTSETVTKLLNLVKID